jgi:hypothetical protein
MFPSYMCLGVILYDLKFPLDVKFIQLLAMLKNTEVKEIKRTRTHSLTFASAMHEERE